MNFHTKLALTMITISFLYLFCGVSRCAIDPWKSYTRDLNLDKNTHLITEIASGAKFKLASSSKPPVIHIVTPSWVHSTDESGQRARESEHALVDTTIHDSAGTGNIASTTSTRDHFSMANDALRERESGDDSNRFLFKNQQFYLIGFEGHPKLKQAISKVIRRGNGTIYWDMNEDISMLVQCDGCDDALRKAAKVVSAHHSNFPPIVSPLWVIESYKHGMMQSVSAYPPTKGEHIESNPMKSTIKSTKKLASTTSNVSIFRGCLFSLVRSSALIDSEQSEVVNRDNMEFDAKDLESLITSHGGQFLSNKLMGALRADKENNKASPKRKCHVVCWGLAPPQLESNPLISQLQRQNLCEIILVTPIWVQASITAKKRIQLDRMPLVLAPQPWPMKSVIKNPTKSLRLEIALTGFQGSEKLIVIHLIEAMGGVYHETMSSANTHLVFKKNPSGLKLEKALEWGLHVVSIRWLYHILRYGYDGSAGREGAGCETRFLFRGKS